MFVTNEERFKTFNKAINFNDENLTPIENIESQWKKDEKKNRSIHLRCGSMERSIIEGEDFWKTIGKLIANDKNLEEIK